MPAAFRAEEFAEFDEGTGGNPDSWKRFTGGNGGNGELWLNMGSRNSIRGIGEGEANEVYYIEHVAGTADNETIRVKFSGREKVYTGVKKLVHASAGRESSASATARVRVTTRTTCSVSSLRDNPPRSARLSRSACTSRISIQ